MKKLIATLALAAFALTTTVVFAQDTKETTKTKTTVKVEKTKKTKAKKTTEEKK